MSAAAVEAIVVATPTHGRCLVVAPTVAPAGILLGFHGYGESADDSLAQLLKIPDVDGWVRVAVDALHAFYERRSERVVRSWMTRDLRQESIEDNLRYVRTLLELLRARFGWRLPVAAVGFSQGASMAWRAACLAGHEIALVAALAGDVPPELGDPQQVVATFPRRALLARGSRDDWYSEAKLGCDRALLERQGVEVTTCRFEGGHEWSAAFRAELARLLERTDSA